MANKMNIDKETLDENAQVRYRPTSKEEKVLINDRFKFLNVINARFENSYIAKIMINYMNYRDDTDRAAFKEEIADLFAGRISTSKDRAKSSYIDRVTYIKDLYSTVAAFKFCSPYQDFKRKIFTEYILEQYCGLEPTQREKIFFYNIYKTVKSCIKNNHTLNIMCRGARGPLDLEFIPILLENDETSFSYYTAGYSRQVNSGKDYGIFSVRFKNIIECAEVNETPPKLNTFELKKKALKHGIAYISDPDTETITVRLDETGYKMFFNNVLRQRPTPTETTDKDGNICFWTKETENKKTYYYVNFDCSRKQIRNYFFSFGKHACIISPADLRSKFAADYRGALKNYPQKYVKPEAIMLKNS